MIEFSKISQTIMTVLTITSDNAHFISLTPQTCVRFDAYMPCNEDLLLIYNAVIDITNTIVVSQNNPHLNLSVLDHKQYILLEGNLDEVEEKLLDHILDPPKRSPS